MVVITPASGLSAPTVAAARTIRAASTNDRPDQLGPLRALPNPANVNDILSNVLYIIEHDLELEQPVDANDSLA
jgi:hypothetical protein